MTKNDDLEKAETSAVDVEKRKPHPDVFEAALRRLGRDTEPKRVFAVGDTPWDAIAAGKISLRTLGVLCGGFPEADLRKAGCVSIYRDPADLLARLEDSPLLR